MADRIYNRTLKCGCMISSDGGGGCMPCCYPGYGATEDEIIKCSDAWNEWKQTYDYKLYKRECIENNNSDDCLKEILEEDKKVRKLFEETGGIPVYLGVV